MCVCRFVRSYLRNECGVNLANHNHDSAFSHLCQNMTSEGVQRVHETMSNMHKNMAHDASTDSAASDQADSDDAPSEADKPAGATAQADDGASTHSSMPDLASHDSDESDDEPPQDTKAKQPGGANGKAPPAGARAHAQRAAAQDDDDGTSTASSLPELGNGSDESGESEQEEEESDDDSMPGLAESDQESDDAPKAVCAPGCLLCTSLICLMLRCV